MDTILLNRPADPNGDRARVARLSRHLKARLEDFGPGGPEVTCLDEGRGLVKARFPGHDTAKVLRRLESECGIFTCQEGDEALFYLPEDTRFEDLDRVWGCLFGLLG